MAINYTKMALIAQRLIDQNGRPATLTLKDRTASDSTKPWRGPGAAITTVAVTAVIVESLMEETDIDGQRLAYSRQLAHSVIRRGNMQAIVAADDVKGIDLDTIDLLSDGTDVWHVINANMLQPGPIPVACIFLLRK